MHRTLNRSWPRVIVIVLTASAMFAACDDPGLRDALKQGESAALPSYSNDVIDDAGAKIVDVESTTPPRPAPWSEGDGGKLPVLDAGVVASRFPSSATCGNCHSTIYKQWRTSMHSRALTSPLVVAQTNQDVALSLANTAKPDPQRLCVNCHAPTAASVTTSSTLPLAPVARGDEGLSCAGCHQFNGNPTSGGGGISTSYQAWLFPGDTFYGPLADAQSGNAHKSAPGVGFTQTNLTCANCHNVNLDLNHDGKTVNGEDLVLQRTFDEYAIYRAGGGTETCTTCHMPALAGITSIADNAPNAPPRVLHDHSFVGVDYALDDPAQEAAQRASREALLRSAARVRIDPASISRTDGLAFSVSLENTSAGHNVPTGFAFARQMWLEVVVTANGNVVFQSGTLGADTDDLCDASPIAENANPLARFVVGCTAVDQSLVNLQTKLVDNVAQKRDATGLLVTDPDDNQPILEQALAGRETTLQFLRGGGVARSRALDGTSLAPLKPFEKRVFAYTVPQVAATQSVNIAVRLRFRHFAPYFVRALAAGQPASETPQLAPLVKAIRIVEVGSDQRTN